MQKTALKVLCFFSLLVNSFAGLLAQHDLDRPSRVIRAEDGLPNHYLRGFTIDANGFAWIGSYEGLAQFDGQNIKTYFARSQDSTTLASSSIASISAHPSNGEVWVGTFNGLSVFNPHTNKFKSYYKSESDSTSILTNFVNWIHIDRTGDTWVSSRSDVLCRYDRKTDNFLRYYPRRTLEDQSTENANLEKENINTISLDPVNDSILWIATNHRFFSFNKFTTQFNYDRPFLPNLEQIFAHPDGKLYLLEQESKIKIYDPVRNSILQTISLEAGWHIQNIVLKSEKELWLSCNKGIAVLNKETYSISYPWLNNANEKREYEIDYVDQQNRLWSINTHGVRIYDTLTTQFDNYFYETSNDPRPFISQYIIESPDGRYLYMNVNGGDGIYRFERATKKWKTIPKPAYYGTQNFNGRDLAFLPNGQLLILVADEVLSLSADGNSMIIHPISQLLPDEKRWINFFVDSKGRVWLAGMDKGLARVDLEANELLVLGNEFPPCKKPRFRFDFYEDSRQNIWLSNCGGFSVFLSESNEFLHFPYSEENPSEHSMNMVDDFVEDKNGILWVSSKDTPELAQIDVRQPSKGFIHKMDPRALIKEGKILVTKGTFKDFSGFSRLALDDNGNLWSLCTEGLFKFDPNLNTIELFNHLEGLQWLDEELKVVTVNRLIKLSTGEMALGFRKGLSIFNPLNLKGGKESPRPYLTSFQVYHDELETDSSLFAIRQIDLAHWQNYFSFEFSTIGYTQPDQYQYRYQLKGVDKGWVYSDQRNYTSYTNVKGGDYIFQAQVANSDGQWNEEALTIGIHVATPWWRQLWFQGGVLFLVIGGIYAFYRYRLKQVEIKGEFEKKFADMELTALRAQMNPHFIFNSLNSIENYIIKNETVKASEYLNGFSRLMRLILQNSRTHLVNLKDEVDALKLYMEMESLRFNHEVDYEVIVEDGLDLNDIDIPPMLIQPYIENGIWHGLRHKGGPGKITLSFAKDGQYLLCSVEDNGVGRQNAAAMKPKNPNRKSMAMNITNERLQTINKLYNTDTSVVIKDLVDQEGKPAGTRVELSIRC